LRDALTGRTPMTALERELADSLAAWEGSGAVMAPILGNHDVGRLISDLNGDDLNAPRTAPPAAPTTTKPYALMQLAFAFLLTQPGAPVVYYGDEFGMPGATDPDNRRDMRFGPALSADEQTLLAVVQRLGGARRCSEALRRGSLETLVVNDNLWIYGRNVNDGAPALVALNRAQVSRDVTLTLPPAWPLLPNATFGDVLGATRVEVTSASGSSGSVPRQITLHLPPRAAAVLLTQPSCQNLR
jgi:glycosidase